MADGGEVNLDRVALVNLSNTSSCKVDGHAGRYRDAVLLGGVTFDISTANDTATAGSDYVANTVAIEFANELGLALDGDRLYAFGMNTPNTVYTGPFFAFA